MLPLELINVIVAAGGAGAMTLMGNAAAERAEERKMANVNYDKAVAEAQAARQAKAKWKGFYWIRGAMALLCASYFFLFPMFAIFVDNVQVAIGYIDLLGIPLFGLDQDMTLWIKFGSGAPDAKVLVYDPVKNNVMLSIIGMYFGNQIARRG